MYGTYKYYQFNDLCAVIGLISIIIVALILIVNKKICINSFLASSNKVFKILLSIFFLTFLIQCFIVQYFPIKFNSDFALIKEQALWMSDHWSLAPTTERYFQSYPNNIVVSVICGSLYKMSHSWTFVMIFCSTIVNFSALLTSLLIKEKTNSKILPIIVLILIEVYYTLSIRTYLPYSSNIGMLFPVLTLFIYLTCKKSYYKWFAIFMVTTIGAYIKITTIIPFIAIICYEIVKFIFNTEKQFQRYFYNIAMLFAVVIVAYGINNSLLKSLEYRSNDRLYHGITYFMMLGQDTNNVGQWNEECSKIGYAEGTKEERDHLFLHKAEENIRKRGLTGNLKFILSKATISFGATNKDTLMHNRYGGVFSLVRQSVWMFFLLGLLLIFKDVNFTEILILQLSIFGVLLYQVIFECGSCYVLLFSPVLFILSSISIKSIFEDSPNCYLQK